MKTKFLFASMVLATAFAACTNEEIVENVAVNDLQERMEFNAPAITVGDGVDSRFSWDATAGAWNNFTANDKFGGGLMDVAKFTTMGEAPLTNYVFAKSGNAYTTTSKMKEGIYFFYSYPGFEKESVREAIPFNLAASQQEIDLADPAANVNAHQLFVSALYKVEAANADLDLPLEFFSYWNTAALKIKNATSEDFKIVRIVLVNSDATNPFVVKGTLKPSALATISKKNADLRKLVYYCENGSYVLPYVDGTASEGRYNSDNIRTLAMATADADGSQGAMMVDVKNGTVKAGESTVAYLQMPAGEYDEGTITAKIHVEVYDEITEKSVVKELEAEFVTNYTDADGVKTIQLRRGKGYNAFGTNPFSIDELSLNVATEGIGAYAASYEDLYQLTVKEEECEIYNMGTLKMDDQAINLMNRLAAKDGTIYKFQNPIVITSEKSSVSLDNVEFLAGATLEKGKLTLGASVVPAGQTLVVGDDAELVLSHKQAGTIENHNKITINTTATGTITVGKDEETSAAHVTEVVIAKNVATDITGLTAPATLTINEGAKVTVPSAYTIPYGTTVDNNGELNSTDNVFYNQGKIKNNAKGYIVSVRNDGTVAADGTTIQVAEIENFGEIKAVRCYENSLITMKSEDAIVDGILPAAGTDSATHGVTGGEVDNSINGFVTVDPTASAVNVFKKYTSDVTGDLVTVMGQNYAKLNGITWDLSNKLTPTIPTNGIELDGVTVKALNSSNGSKLNVILNDVVSAVSTTFNCNVTIDSESATTATAPFDFTGSIFKGALTIKDGGNIEHAVLNNVTFAGATKLNNLTTVELYGTVAISGTWSAPDATAFTVGHKNADNTYAETTVTVNGNAAIAKTTAVGNVLANATLTIGTNAKLDFDGISMTVAGKLVDRNTSSTLGYLGVTPQVSGEGKLVGF